jgi:hypothetical protein
MPRVPGGKVYCEQKMDLVSIRLFKVFQKLLPVTRRQMMALKQGS